MKNSGKAGSGLPKASVLTAKSKPDMKPMKPTGKGATAKVMSMAKKGAKAAKKKGY
jgi:hypothetical protein